MIVVNRNDEAPFRTKDGAQIRSILDRSTAPVRNQSLAEATVPPGRATAPHRHPAAEEIYYVLSGRGDLTVSEETRPVGPADAVLIPPGTRHQVRNNGDEPLVFLCCCAPPYAHDDTILDPSPAQETPS
jgi:mannose-6-phosphate isomerase-like protein (cupin superfamily)